jgi:chorismate mutase
MSNELREFRHQIDALDQEIIALLARRFHIAQKVAHIKQQQGIKVRLQDRISAVLENSKLLAVQNNADPEAIYSIYQAIIEATCAFEERKMGETSE